MRPTRKTSASDTRQRQAQQRNEVGRQDDDAVPLQYRLSRQAELHDPATGHILDDKQAMSLWEGEHERAGNRTSWRALSFVKGTRSPITIRTASDPGSLHELVVAKMGVARKRGSPSAGRGRAFRLIEAPDFEYLARRISECRRYSRRSCWPHRNALLASVRWPAQKLRGTGPPDAATCRPLMLLNRFSRPDRHA